MRENIQRYTYRDMRQEVVQAGIYVTYIYIWCRHTYIYIYTMGKKALYMYTLEHIYIVVIIYMKKAFTTWCYDI